jgi:O-glycosyl hydrolase
MRIFLNPLILMFSFLISSFLWAGCFHSGGENSQTERIVIDPFTTYQTMEGFGASDAWRVQFVGKNWPEEKRDSIADLLFSREMDENGNPKGIGLSQWRFYIGAGSMEQGDASGVSNPWRRAESFLNADGTYDWSKQAGQQWFLRAAKDRGLEKLLAFSISAPVHMTKNGKAWSEGGDNFNIKPEMMDGFADFLASVAGYFDGQGLTFDYISPFNEPQWDWKAPASQEGTPALNSEIAEVSRLLSTRLLDTSPNSQIVIPEAAELQFLYGRNNKPGRQNQIDDFFNPSSENYIGDLPNLKKSVLGHSYFTTNENGKLIDIRRSLAQKLDEYNGDLNYWQSEFCILERHEDIGAGWERDLGMPTALYVARVIHHDITVANATLWSWWTALSEYDFKDGLIHLDNGNDGIRGPENPESELLKENGFFRETKLLWALGNYSLFVRPGMHRIRIESLSTVSLPEQADNLMVSGYINNADSTLVLVMVNYSAEAKKVTIDNLGKSFQISDNRFDAYTTSDKRRLTKSVVSTGDIEVEPRSVMTLVSKISYE